MAKLKKDLAEKAASEADSFGVLPTGLYLCKLRNVDASRSGPAGPYWVWEYETIDIEGQPSGRRFWDNTSLSEKAIGRLGSVFAAFGATPDTDTDDLISMLVTIEVGIGTVQKGERAGEQRNEVRSVMAATAHPSYADVEAAGEGGAANPDDFA